MTILSHMAPDNIFTLENCIQPPWYGCQLRNFIVFYENDGKRNSISNRSENPNEL